MYRTFFIFLLSVLMYFFQTELLAQNDPARPSVVKIEGAGQFSRTDADKSAPANQQIILAEGFSYYTTPAGIYMYFPRPNNNVRLFALTGQLIWSGELVSGRFFIPTGVGIYFLRVNNKSYKVSCK
ncbi:MAG: hypothetical protein PHQ11_03970 [Paludibacter sp.]|nr:hypothetical protein [Paludibacter sp.]MDD4198276.1 hypothetical protein [Paludibacter sp.]MDD4426988.1 hypothetical protein [Paludibacter sp.]